MTKRDSEVAEERELLGKLSPRPNTTSPAACERNNVEWTILRPTLIYEAGRDTNITPLSRLIRRFGFMPLVGGGSGLRQPVHAEDLAIGAIAAASSAFCRQQVLFPARRRDDHLSRNDRPDFRRNATAKTHHPGTRHRLEDCFRLRQATVSRRKRSNGHPHDEEPDFRSYPCHARFWLETEGLPSNL